MSKRVDTMVKELKRLLNEATDYGDVMNYFFDITEGTDFNEMGRPKNNPNMMRIIHKSAEAILGKTLKSVDNPALIYVKKYNLYHGPCFINGQMGTIIYFAGIDRGMIALSQPNGETLCARLTTTPMD